MFYTAGKTSPVRTHRPAMRMEEPVKVRRGATHEEIASLAYSYWIAGGRRNDSTLSDWLRAERALNDR
jgi:hypothetical protein